VPTAGEVFATDFVPTFGYSDVQGAIDKVKAVLNPAPTGGGAPVVHTVVRRHYVVGVAGLQSSSATGFVAVGALSFQPEDYRPTVPTPVLSPQHVQFGALIESAGGLTGAVRLFDLSVGTGVPGSVLATTDSVPTYILSSDLALATGSVQYEVQALLGSSPTGPTGADAVVVKLAQLEVTHG